MSEPPAHARSSAPRGPERASTARLAALGMLVACVAHEINTLVSALSCNHQVLKQALGRLCDILDGEAVAAAEIDEVGHIVHALDGVIGVNDVALERVSQLVEGLRSFGRFDSATVRRIDLHENIDAAVTLLRAEVKDRIRIVRAYGLLPPIECYAHELNQVFTNLLRNAAQAIPEQGTITIRSWAEGAHVVVEVEDTGIGIPPDDLARIFEPGFTTKRARAGTGLGLAIARQIVERHGGRIRVRSTRGSGSTFSVSLPIRAGD
jgi:signal transduction histidine kinase